MVIIMNIARFHSGSHTKHSNVCKHKVMWQQSHHSVF